MTIERKTPENKLNRIAELEDQVKNIQQVLSDLTQRQEIIAEIAQDYIFIINLDDTIEYVNQYAAKQLTTTPDQLIGKPRASLFPPLISTRQKKWLEYVIQKKESIRTEDISVIGSKTIWLDTSLIPILDDEGNPRAVLGVSRDITARKIVENELLDYRLDLEKKVSERTADLEKVNQALQMDIVQRKARELLLKKQRDLGIELSLCSSTDEAVLAVKNTLMSIEGIDAGGIYVTNLEQGQIVLHSSWGVDSDFLNKVTHIGFDNAKYRIVKMGTPVYYNLSDGSNCVLAEMKQTGLTAFAAIPINIAGNPAVCINLGSRTFVSFPVFIKSCIESIGTNLGAILTRLAAVNALQESETKYRNVVENAGEAIVVAQDEYLKFVNSKSPQIIGWSVEDLISKPFEEFVHPEDRAMVISRYKNRIENKEMESRYEFRLITETGTTRWVEINAVVIHWQGKPATLNFLTDITDRVENERLLKLFRIASESSVAGCILFSDLGKILFVNDSWAMMHGYDVKDILDESIALFFKAEFYDSHFKPFLEKVNQNGSFFGEMTQKKKDGSSITTFLIITLVAGSAQKPQTYIASAIDMTEKKNAEIILKENESRMRAIFEGAQDVAFIIVEERDSSFFITEFSPGAERVFQHEKSTILGCSIAMLLPEEERSQYLGNTESGLFSEGFKHEISLLKGFTMKFPALVSSYLMLKNTDVKSWLIVVIDITERKKAEEERLRLESQLIQMQKINSLGLMAGGVAHDFNNLLTSILGNAELALLKIPEPAPITENIHRIIGATRRAAELTNQMLTFAGKSQSSTKLINLSKIVQETTSLLRASIPKNIIMNLNCPKGIPNIEADPAQILQIIMNLVINASEAIGSQPGIITVNTGVIRADKELLKHDCYPSDDFTETDCAFLEVIDTGSGMTPETKQHLFDPFYTTKFAGRGLGLATVLGIVRNHKGLVKIISELGQGTQMSIMIPICQKEVESPSSDDSSEMLPSDGEIILLIDDEEIVLSSVALMLQTIGYQVLKAQSGCEGLDFVKSNASKISAVILDLIMPEMDGIETLREIRKIDPLIKIIIASGYSDENLIRQIDRNEISGFIQKPFHLKDLVHTLKIGMSRKDGFAKF